MHTHLNRVTRTVYPLSSKFQMVSAAVASSLEQMRLLTDEPRSCEL